MAWEYGFFNSVNGDRLYNADAFNKIFDGLIGDGVYASVGNKLAVQPNSGMVIQIGSGRAWFNKHWVNNTSELLLTLDASDVVLNRYGAIVVRVDESDSVRSAEVVIKYSDFATTPVKPQMTRTELVKEYCLAYVYIRAGATAITASDITDTRGDNNLCGWVTGLIEQLSTTTLFEQWEAIFRDWFNDLTGVINENTETMLVGALPTSLTVILNASDWQSDESGAYTQTVDVLGMSETKTVIVSPASTSETNWSASEIECISQGANSLTFRAVTTPNYDIEVEIAHMGV